MGGSSSSSRTTGASLPPFATVTAARNRPSAPDTSWAPTAGAPRWPSRWTSPLEGEIGLGAAANVWLEADLTKYTAYRPGTLYWMCQPGNAHWVGSGTMDPMDRVGPALHVRPGGGRVRPFRRGGHRPRTTLGDPDVDITIKSTSLWRINSVVAKQYRIARVLLAGDTAHRHPQPMASAPTPPSKTPSTLAWKLALVVRGLAGDERRITTSGDRLGVRSLIGR